MNAVAVDLQAAAEAIGVSANTFRALVDEGAMPRPRVLRQGVRKAIKRWDLEEVRACFRDLPRDGGEDANDDGGWSS